MPEKVQETTKEQESQGGTQKSKNQQNQPSKKKLGGSSKSLPEPHKSKHQNVVLNHKKPLHKAKQKPIELGKRDTNSKVFDVLAVDENVGFEALKSLLRKYSDQIGKDLVAQLLSSAGSAMDYLTGSAMLSAQPNWTGQINSYVDNYTGFQDSVTKMGTAIDKYGTALKTAHDTYQTVNSPGLHLVRVFLKYVIGRGTAYVMSLGKKATPKTIHNVTVMSESLSYLTDLQARYDDLKRGISNRSMLLGHVISLAEKAAKTSKDELAKLQNFTLSQLLAWGWQKMDTGKSFSDFVLTNNSKIGKVGSGGILLAAMGFLAAAGSLYMGQPQLASKLAIGSTVVGTTGLAAKYYDHNYMGKEDEQEPEKLNLPKVQAPQGKKPQDSPDKNRFFWMNMHHTDIKSWDSTTPMENQQGYLSQLIWGKEDEPMYKSGGAEIKFGMGFNIFGRKLLNSDDHTVRLDWGGNFEYKNDDMLITDQLLKLNKAFEIGAVHLTKIRITNQGLQSMGLELKKVNVAGDTFQVSSMKAEWSKDKGLHFETAAKANLLDHQFDGTLNFDLDNDGKLINGDISIGSGDQFEILKDVLTISNFLLSGSIDENNKVTIGAESDMDLLKDNNYFNAKVGKAYVKYDQTRKKPWLAGVNTFDAQIMGGRIGISFNDAHLKDNQLDIAKAQLMYTKGGSSNGDDEALKGGGIFGDLENIFSIIKTLQVSATVGKVSLSKASFKFGEAPKWALNEFTAAYAGFMLSLKITDQGLKGKLAGSFDQHYNIFKVLVETPIPAVPGANLVGKAALDANLGARASLDVTMDNKDKRNQNNKGDKYLKISGNAGFKAGVGLTAGLGASIGLANVASISGMLMGRFGVEMAGDLQAGATLVFNRNADKVLRQGELPDDKFKMRAEATVTPTFDISGGLFFNLLQQEFSLAQYSLARWELGKGQFAFEAAPDEKGKYRLTPDQNNTKLNGRQFLKDRKKGFSKAVKGISPEREKYIKLRQTFDQAEEALGNKSKNYDELVEQLTEQGKGAESQMLDTLSIMVAKHEALVRLKKNKEASRLQSGIRRLKRDTKKVLMINHDPRAAVEYLHYYRTKKSVKAGFNKMLRKHFAIWDWRLLNRYAKNSLEKDGVERVNNPGLFGKKKDKKVHSQYSAKLRQREIEINKEFDVDSKLEQHVNQKEKEQEPLEHNQLEQELVEEVRKHVKELESDIGPRKKRTPDTE
ncbi:hypothetical protein [Microscilla marina]|uniref:Uncharacterized protein n=1 Tax=Microscilla marina ATCC 23134 TaxID=313606 RepID=A1ZRZ8_MICM2|nr:hypothetical protein [Microscilla marina]EAY26886.1 hypothetical protein M23134_04836 [Microscilla marina ATCC 23134]